MANCKNIELTDNFEHTPEQMSAKLLEFNRDFSDNDEEINA